MNSNAPSAPLINQQVPERVPDYPDACYQRTCLDEYLYELHLLSHTERESRLSSIAARIKSGYRQLPIPKHIHALIRFNDQRKMHFKFWLRMRNRWPFTGSEEEMAIWHEVDDLSTRLYEMVYELDQQQMKLKQQVEDRGKNVSNEHLHDNDNSPINGYVSDSSHAPASDKEIPSNGSSGHDQSANPQKPTKYSRSSSMPKNSSRISSTTKSSKLHRNKNNTNYKCLIGNCINVARNPKEFQNHQRTHTGAKPYRCSVSGCKANAFARIDSIRRHIQEVHYRDSKMNRQFFDQFIETDEEQLNFDPSKTS